MPVVRFKSTKLPEEKKDDIATKAYEELVKVLHIPHIEIFFDEYEAVYAFGKKFNEYDGIDCIIEGPEISPENLSALSTSLMDVFRNCLNNPKLNFTAIYHVNDDYHVTLNEKILAQHRKEIGK